MMTRSVKFLFLLMLLTILGIAPPALSETSRSFCWLLDSPFDQPTSSGNFDLMRGICYMGDYNQMTADEKSFYLAWGDNRNILKDVYFAKIRVGLEPQR